LKGDITMTPNESLHLIDELGNILREGSSDFLRQAVEKLYNMLMNLEVEDKTGASRYERTPERITSRNGTRQRPLETTVGMVDLAIPKLRNGSYMPSFIEPRRMTDKALVSVIQEA
jgi:putative transposase